MALLYELVDEITVNQLIESNFLNPVITDIISDPHSMYELVRRGLPLTEKGHLTVWDPPIFDSAWKCFQDGTRVVEKQLENGEIELNLIVETTKENIDRVNSLKFPNIRHVELR